MENKPPSNYDPLPQLDPANDKKYITLLNELTGGKLTDEEKKAVVDFVKMQCQLVVHTISKEDNTNDKGANK